MAIVQLMLLSLMVSLTYSIRNTHRETRNVIIFLKSDGTIDPSATLNCHDTGMIDLISNRFEQRQCSNCISTYEEPLPAAAELHLHQTCSLKEICSNLTFPVTSSLQRNKINYVNIHFRCVGQNNIFVHMCEKRKFFFNDTLHLTTSDTTKYFKKCTCWVNHGKFSLTLNEIRLNNKYANQCSTAKLMINTKPFSCKPTMDGFGAIYKDTYIDQLPLGAFVSLEQNSTDVSPDMIWLTFEPEELSKIECAGIRTEPEIFPTRTVPETTTAVSTTQSYTILYTSSRTTTNGEGKKMGETSSTNTTIYVLTAVCIVLVLVIAGFIIHTVCRKLEINLRFMKMFEQRHDEHRHESQASSQQQINIQNPPQPELLQQESHHVSQRSLQQGETHNKQLPSLHQTKVNSASARSLNITSHEMEEESMPKHRTNLKKTGMQPDSQTHHYQSEHSLQHASDPALAHIKLQFSYSQLSERSNQPITTCNTPSTTRIVFGSDDTRVKHDIGLLNEDEQERERFTDGSKNVHNSDYEDKEYSIESVPLLVMTNNDNSLTKQQELAMDNDNQM